MMICTFLLVPFARGQRADYLRINEVLSGNTESLQDEYGKHSPWIEIYNKSYAKVNIGGCYLTNDSTNKTKYLIPKEGSSMLIPARGHLLFWAEGETQKGALHINFSLDSQKSNWIALYNSNGKDLIDSVTIPPLKENQSWGRVEDGVGEWSFVETPTPRTNNKLVEQSESIARFKKYDSVGIGMTITAMCVVFSALILLWWAFSLIGKISMKATSCNIKKESKEEHSNNPQTAKTSGEVYAAIAMALSEMEEEAHDLEEHRLTIEKVHRTYSPWNSKIYAMLPKPRK